MIVRGIFFDLDGTLVNSLSDLAGSVNEIRDEYELPRLSQGVIRSHVGKGAAYLVGKTLAELVGRFTLEELATEYRVRCTRVPHRGGYLYPGVVSTLDGLVRRGCVIGIVTNKPTEAAEAALRHYLPQVRWDIVAGPETVSERKPSPRHLLEVLDRLGLKSSEAVFVGDDPVDAACARSAGVAFYAAAYGLGGVTADRSHTLDQFSDLLNIF